VSGPARAARLVARGLGLAGIVLPLLVAGGCINNEDAPPNWTYSVCIDYCGAPTGQLAGNDTTCGPQPGQCSCTLGTGLFCGQCTTNDLCVYCPSGSLCPSDPCSPTCTWPSQPSQPPSSPPASPQPAGCTVDCGNGRCCWTGYPICCGNPDYCGASAAACDTAGQPPIVNSSSSSGGSGSSSGSSSGTCPCTDNGASCMNDPTVVSYTNQCANSVSQEPCYCAAAATNACFYAHGCYAEAGCQTSVTEATLSSGCQSSEQSAEALGGNCGIGCPP
jgi:hypothetical protein